MMEKMLKRSPFYTDPVFYPFTICLSIIAVGKEELNVIMVGNSGMGLKAYMYTGGSSKALIFLFSLYNI